jgi:hypothetical protein
MPAAWMIEWAVVGPTSLKPRVLSSFASAVDSLVADSRSALEAGTLRVSRSGANVQSSSASPPPSARSR